MKTFPLPRLIFRLIVGALMVVMGIFLMLAFLQFTKPEDVVLPQRIGTLNVNADWKAILKDNSFFSGKELGRDYAYISELVDYLSIELNFDYADGPKDAPVSIDYQVDGTLKADYGAANSTVMLLKLQYPQIAKGTISGAGSAFSDVQPFELSLMPYNYLINSFQSAYQVSVTAQLSLAISATLSIEAQGQTVTKDLQLSLNIPLGNTVFQVSGTPSSKLEVFLPLADGGGNGSYTRRAVNFILVAAGMAVLALLCYLFLAPNQPDKRDILIRQTLQKVKNRMVTLTSDPRQSAKNLLIVSDIASIIILADETSQPILYYKQSEEHCFFIQHQDTLYVCSMGIVKLETPQGNSSENE